MGLFAIGFGCGLLLMTIVYAIHTRALIRQLAKYADEFRSLTNNLN